MSEADVIREHIVSDAESIDEQWGCVHIWADMTPGCAGYTGAVQALASLDSLTTRLAEVERERDEAQLGKQPRTVITLLMQPVGDAIDPHIDADKVAEVLNAHTEALREQLTQAREALERLSKIDPLDESNLPFIDAPRELQARIEFAANALATINREGETES